MSQKSSNGMGDEAALIIIMVMALVALVMIGRGLGTVAGVVGAVVLFSLLPQGNLRIFGLMFAGFLFGAGAYFLGSFSFGDLVDEVRWLSRGLMPWTEFALDTSDPAGQLLAGAAGACVLAGAFASIWDNPAKAAYRAHKRMAAQDVQGLRPVRGMAKINTAQASDAAHKEATLIGAVTSSGKRLYLSDKDLNTHALVTGTTGSGKTVFVANLIESFIARRHPVIFIDGKGDLTLSQRVRSYAAQQGRPTWGFSMVGASCAYNPLASGGFSSKKDRVVELRRWSEEHYRKLAEGYLQTVFKILEAVGDRVDLKTTTQFLDTGKLLSLIRAQKAALGEEFVQALSEEIADQRDAEKHIEGVRAELRNLSRSELGPLFDTAAALEAEETVLTLAEVLRRRGVAYFALSPLRFPALSDTLGKLIVNDLKACLDPERPQKILLVIDEFTTLAGEQVLNILNQGRSMGVHGLITVQSLADLGQKIDRNADLFAAQIISNCNVFAVHRMNNPADAGTLAEVIGTKNSLEITAHLGETGATGKGSARHVREFLAHPDAIKNLPTGEAFLANKNAGTVVRIKGRLSQIMEL